MLNATLVLRARRERRGVHDVARNSQRRVERCDFMPDYSNTMRFTSVPIPPPCQTVKTSPFFISLCGLRNQPMPLGVPIKTMLPAGSVVPDERKERDCATVKIMSLCSPGVSGGQDTSRPTSQTHEVLSFCIDSPFSLPSKARFCTSPIASVATMQGPMGQNLSKPFAKFHCVWRAWWKRAVMSFALA